LKDGTVGIKTSDGYLILSSDGHLLERVHDDKSQGGTVIEKWSKDGGYTYTVARTIQINGDFSTVAVEKTLEITIDKNGEATVTKYNVPDANVTYWYHGNTYKADAQLQWKGTFKNGNFTCNEFSITTNEGNYNNTWYRQTGWNAHKWITDGKEMFGGHWQTLTTQDFPVPDAPSELYQADRQGISNLPEGLDTAGVVFRN